LQPGASWIRLRADNTIRPDHGDRLFFEVSAASDQLGSDTSFIQTIAESRWIRSLADRSRILARIRAGATWNRDFNELPPSARYFAGGDNSVRGYEFRSQGPVDADGDVVGGDRLLVASIEYEYELREKWSVATFYDAGNAFHAGKLDAVAGFGIGARWQSPLGPIRIDVARPLDGIDRDLRLHISLGPDL
jgi:translocation and assembly module TamA